MADRYPRYRVGTWIESTDVINGWGRSKEKYLIVAIFTQSGTWRYRMTRPGIQQTPYSNWTDLVDDNSISVQPPRFLEGEIERGLEWVYPDSLLSTLQDEEDPDLL